MYENLKGKKLLILGSDFCDRLIVEAAQSLGVYAIAADGKTFSDGTPAKQAADEHWDIDYTDLDTLEQKCREAGVRGVLAGYSEFRVLNACRLAKRLGLPFYATEEQLGLTGNKRRFKEMCSKCGIGVPEYFSIHRGGTAECITEKAGRLGYPLVVKAADNAGGRGMTVCHSREALVQEVETALQNSCSGEAMIEEFLSGQEICARYVIRDGKAVLCSLQEYLHPAEGHTTGFIELTLSSSALLTEYLSETEQKVQRFFREMKMQNGVVCFEGIYTEKGFRFFETGYRLDGGNEHCSIAPVRGTDYVKMMIAFALTGSMTDDVEKNDPYFPGVLAKFQVYSHACTIAELSYKGELEPMGITRVLPFSYPGAVIRENGITSKRMFAFYIHRDTIEQLIETIEYIQDHLLVLDTENNDPLYPRVDAEKLLNAKRK